MVKTNKLLALLLSLAMIIGMVPCTIAAEPADTITVCASVSQGDFLLPPQDILVEKGLAASYGYAVGSDEITAFDALVAVHKALLGEEFTPDTASTYLSISSSGWLTNVMASGSAFGFMVNGRTPNDGIYNDAYMGYTAYTIDKSVLKENDRVEFYFYLDPAYYTDNYAWFDNSSLSVSPNESFTLSLQGFSAAYYGASTEEMIAAMTEPISDAIIATGTDINSLVPLDLTDENGQITLSFPEQGTYYVAAIGEEDLPFTSTICVVEVVKEFDGKAFFSLEDTIETPEGETWPGPSGVLIPRTSVGFYAGESVTDVILRALTEAGLDYDNSSGYITEIAGLGQTDRGPQSGWMFTLNDWFTASSISEYTIAEGDEIRGLYSLAWGADIGSDWSNTNTALAALSFSKGSLSPAFDSGVYSYTLTIPDTVKELVVTPSAANKNYQVRTYLDTFDAAQPGYQRSAAIPVQNGTKLIIGVGDPSWPTMNSPSTLQKYEITVKAVKHYPLSFTVPSDAELFVGTKLTHFTKFPETKPTGNPVDNQNGTKTYTFNLAENQEYNYRVTKEGKLTYANKFKMTASTTKLSVTDAMLDSSPSLIIRDDSYYEGNLLLNTFPQGSIKLNTGDTFQLLPLRAWQLVDSTVNNYFLEPDYHYEILEGDSVSIDSETAVITAEKAGTSILKVTYDALNAYDHVYSAIWPENTGIVIVQVDSGAESLATGISLDSDFDTVYYLQEKGGADYTFTPAEGAAVEVANPVLSKNSVTYSSYIPAAKNSNGSFTARLTHGRNILRITKDGMSEYQVVTARPLTLTVENTTNPGGVMGAGDTVKVTFGGLSAPVPKMAGIYNFSNKIQYQTPAGETVSSKAGQYNFILNRTMEVTLPADWDGSAYTLTGGTIHVSGFGDPFGSHREIDINSGKNPNFTAVMQNGDFCTLPDITLSNPVYSGSVAIYKADGTVVNSLSQLKSGDSVYAKATVINPDKTEKSPIVLFAAYKDGKLVAMQKQSFSSSDESFTLETPALEYQEGTTLKAFIWNGTENLVPLGDVKSL